MSMFMVLPHDHGHCESSPGSFDECRLSARWPPTLIPSQPTWPVSTPVGCYHPHPQSPFIIITQSESRHSFYGPTEDGRLSWPRHCRKGAQPMPKAVRRSGCHDKHNSPWPLTRQPCMLPLDHCNLQRHMGVNNLPKVVILYLYLYPCLQPFALGQKGLLADHLLSSNKILRVQRKAVLVLMLVQSLSDSTAALNRTHNRRVASPTP